MPYRDTRLTCQNCGKEFIFTVEEQRRLANLGFEVVFPSLCPECQKRAAPSAGPQEGIVKWYDPQRGYGFIIQRSGEEIFFHRTSITVGDPENVPEGARVTYQVEQTVKGPQAVQVSVKKEEGK